jgi:hypothetical protein
MNVKYETVRTYQSDDDTGNLVTINGRFMVEVVNEIRNDYTILLDSEPDRNLIFDDKSEMLEYLFFQHLFYEYGKLKVRNDRTKWFTGFDVVKYLKHHDALNKADLERFINRLLDHYSTAQAIVYGQFAEEIKGIFRQLVREMEQKPITFKDIVKISIRDDKRINNNQWIGSAKDAGIFLAKLKFYNHLTVENQAEIIRLFIDMYNPKGSTSTLIKSMSNAMSVLQKGANHFKGMFTYLKR